MRRGRATATGFALLIGALAFPRGAGAQELRGVVRDSVSRLAIPGAVVTLLDSATALAARTITNERGEFRAILRADGVRRVRVVRLGFRPAEVAVPRGRDGTIQLDITLVALPSMARATGGDLASSGLIVTTFLAGYAPGQLVWGYVGDRGGSGRNGPNFAKGPDRREKRGRESCCGKSLRGSWQSN